jgi:L-methionine (R)-S-oxide reductase
MMFELPAIATKNKEKLYAFLDNQVKHLLADETDLIASCANFTALLFYYLSEVNWVGFYFLKEKQLVLGPFQGKPACVRINLGQGVCGTAAREQKTVIVHNVHQFPGHIACDPVSNSEIVLPVIQNKKLIAVLDIDSPAAARFTEEDRQGLEKLVNRFVSFIN